MVKTSSLPILIITKRRLLSSQSKNQQQCMKLETFIILNLILKSVLELSQISFISLIKGYISLLKKELNFSLPSQNFYKVKMQLWEELFMLVSKKWKNSLQFMLLLHHFSKIFITRILTSGGILLELYL